MRLRDLHGLDDRLAPAFGDHDALHERGEVRRHREPIAHGLNIRIDFHTVSANAVSSVIVVLPLAELFCNVTTKF